jgi:hypothetical protein
MHSTNSLLVAACCGNKAAQQFVYGCGCVGYMHTLVALMGYSSRHADGEGRWRGHTHSFSASFALD